MSSRRSCVLPILALAFCLPLPSLAAVVCTTPATPAVDGNVPAPNGVNDTENIQKALDWANRASGTNRTVQLQAGTYRVDTLCIGSRTVLLGTGSAGTILRLRPNQPNGRNVLRSEGGHRKITLQGITFDGNKAEQREDGVALQVVRMIDVVDLTIDDCIFRNGVNNGLVLQASTGLESNTVVRNSSALDNEERGFYPSSLDEIPGGLRDVTFENCLARGNSGGFSGYLVDGLHFNNCIADSNGFIAHGTVYGGDGFQIGQDDNPGFTIDSSIDVTYTDCVAKDNARDGFTSYARARPTQGLTYTRCTSVRNGALHAADNATALNARGFRVMTSHAVSYIDCKSSSNGVGFEIVTSLQQHLGTDPIVTHDVLIQGADVRKNRKQGIRFQGVTDSAVTGSVVVNNGTWQDSTYDGILLENGILDATAVGSQRIAIADSLIKNTDGLPHQRYGIRSIGDSDFITLRDNTLSGNSLPSTTAVSYLLVGTHNVVQGND
jgi:Pectate lyase superfamily protein